MKIYEELKEKYEGIEKYSLVSGDWEDAGVEAYKGGNYLEAVGYFQRVIVAIPDHYNAYEMCSYALYECNNQKEAIKYLEAGIEIAESFEGDAELPKEMVEDMRKSLEKMKKNEGLDREYIGEIME